MAQAVEGDGAAGSGGDLFIVDDTPANLGLLAAILREAGHSVRVANSGRRALSAIRAAPPELILLDINMPEMSGLEVCAELKAGEATAEIPVVFLSALDGLDEKLRAFGAGGLDYVTKPFQAAEVLARVEMQLRLSRLRRALADKNRELERANAELLAARTHAQQIFAALTDVLSGSVLDGRYRLDDKIGSGGTAAVYRGVVLASGEPVAVKVLRPRPGDGPPQVGRAASEHRSLARIVHPNAVSVLDSGQSAAGIAYVVMELLSGRSLAEELAAVGRLPFARCAEILLPVAEVLAEAHAAGVVHRDVKPANIFLHASATGEIAKVVDFGIARLDDDVAEHGRSGWLTGTPVYMAPERLLGQRYDGRADVYGLGVTLYQALSGILPFRTGHSLGSVIMSCIHDPPLPLRKAQPDVPEELEALVLRALAKRPGERPSMAELHALLGDALRRAPPAAAGSEPGGGPAAPAGGGRTLTIED